MIPRASEGHHPRIPEDRLKVINSVTHKCGTPLCVVAGPVELQSCVCMSKYTANQLDVKENANIMEKLSLALPLWFNTPFSRLLDNLNRVEDSAEGDPAKAFHAIAR